MTVKNSGESLSSQAENVANELNDLDQEFLAAGEPEPLGEKLDESLSGSGDLPEIDVTPYLQMLYSGIYGEIAKRRGAHWLLDGKDSLILAKATDRVVSHYMSSIKLTPIGGLVAAVSVVTLPKLGLDVAAAASRKSAPPGRQSTTENKANASTQEKASATKKTAGKKAEFTPKKK